jgi:hypothetical protein
MPLKQLIAAIILKPDRFREFEPGVRTSRVSKFPYSILLHFQKRRRHDLSLNKSQMKYSAVLQCNALRLKRT